MNKWGDGSKWGDGKRWGSFWNCPLGWLRGYFRPGVIIGAFPYTIANGQAIDAVPVMADFNWILSQVNANGASQTDIATVTALVAAVGATVQTYSPVLAFGGASVGITYGGNTGYYIQIGKLVALWSYVQLTSKGSSSGAATISLPSATSSNMTIATANVLPWAAMPLGCTNPANAAVAIPVGGSATVALRSINYGGAVVNFSDTNFTNTSGFAVSGAYFVP